MSITGQPNALDPAAPTTPDYAIDISEVWNPVPVQPANAAAGSMEIINPAVNTPGLTGTDYGADINSILAGLQFQYGGAFAPNPVPEDNALLLSTVKGYQSMFDGAASETFSGWTDDPDDIGAVINNGFIKAVPWAMGNKVSGSRLIEAGMPTFLSYLDNASKVNKDSVGEAFSVIQDIDFDPKGNAANAIKSSGDLNAVLSDYYGYDMGIYVGGITNLPANQIASGKGLNRYGFKDSNGTFDMFSVAVKQIMKHEVPYVQMTKGLNYRDAVEYLYEHDPMIQAIAAKSGVNLYAEGDSGSVYVFDPLINNHHRIFDAGKERDDFGNFLKVVAGIVITTFTAGALAPAASALLGAAAGTTTAAGTALAGAVASAGTSFAMGAEDKDIIFSAVMGGLGGYAKGLQAEALIKADQINAALEMGDMSTALRVQSSLASTTAAIDLTDTIYNSANAVKALTEKDFVGALTSGLMAMNMPSINEYVTDTLQDMIGTEDFYGMQIDDFSVGVTKFATKLLDGANPEDALKSAVVEYAKHGGSFPDLGIKFGGFDFADLGESEIWDKIKDSDIVEVIRKLGKDFDDTVLQPTKNTLIAIGHSVDDNIMQPPKELLEEVGKRLGAVVGPVGKSIDDAIIQPTRQVLKSFDDNVTQPISNVVDQITRAIPDLDLSANLPAVSTRKKANFSGMSTSTANVRFNPLKTSDHKFMSHSQFMRDLMENFGVAKDGTA